MKEQTIGELVAVARGGDAAAFEELYRRTVSGMMGLALSMLKHEQDALDVLQESYLYAFGKLDQLERPEAFAAWLYRLVANRCKNFLARTRPKLFAASLTDEEGGEWELEDEDEALRPEESVDSAETRRLVLEMVDALPEDQRICVLLHYFQGRKVAEIAELLEVSENTVKSRLSYARKKLRVQAEALEQEGTVLHGGAVVLLLIPQVFADGAAQGLAAGGAALLEGILSGAGAAGAAAATTGAAAGTAVTTGAVAGGGAGAGGFLGTVAGKVAAGLVAAAVAVGGGAAVLLSRPAAEPDAEPAPVVSEAPPVVVAQPEPEPEPAPERVWVYVFDEAFADRAGGLPPEEFRLEVRLSAPCEVYRFDDSSGEVWVGLQPGEEFQAVFAGVGGAAGEPSWTGDEGVLQRIEGDALEPVYRAVGEGTGELSLTWTNEAGREAACRVYISVPGMPPVEEEVVAEPEPEVEPEPEPEPASSVVAMRFLFLDEAGNAFDGVVAVGVRIGGYTIVLDDRSVGRDKDVYYSDDERAGGQTIVTAAQAEELGLVRNFSYTATSLSFETGEDVYPTFYYGRDNGSNSVGSRIRASGDQTVVIRFSGNSIRFEK